jgi:hypothetical protein
MRNGGCDDGTDATIFGGMSAITVRIPDSMDKPLRVAAAGAPSLNEYIVKAVRRQMTIDAARQLAAIESPDAATEPLDLHGEGDAL